MIPNESTPGDGFTVPGPTRGARRVPEDLAFTVRPKWGRAIGFGAVIGAQGLLPPVIMLAVGLDEAFARYPLFIVMVGAFTAFTIGCGVFLTMALGGGGPLAGCDETGVWLRARQYPVVAVFLPWQAIRVIYPRRRKFQTMVCVQTHDPDAGAVPGVLASLERAQARLITGAGLFIATQHADTKAPEILRAFAHYARGRCQVESP